jgi:hypothetical protein
MAKTAPPPPTPPKLSKDQIIQAWCDILEMTPKPIAIRKKPVRGERRGNPFIIFVATKEGEYRPLDLVVNVFFDDPARQMPYSSDFVVRTPAGRVYFALDTGFTNRNTLRLIEEQCQRHGRIYGLLQPDLTCTTQAESFSLQDCEVFDFRELRGWNPHRVFVPGTRVVETIEQLYTKRGEQYLDLEVYTFRDDGVAHDDELQAEVRDKFAKRFQSLKKIITKAYGDPIQEAAPHSSFREAIWSLKRRSRKLHLIMEHQDRELPVTLTVRIR